MSIPEPRNEHKHKEHQMADTKTETAPAPMIKLSEAQWGQFAAQSDRTKPSPYQDDVNAAGVGDRFAVPLPIDDGEPTGDRAIVNNLHKAAKVANKNIQVMVRKNTEPPAVLWRILDGEYSQPTRNKTAETPTGQPVVEGDSPTA